MDGTASQILGAAETVRRKTRRARRALWLPLGIFGLVVLGATPFYHQASRPPGPAITCTGTVETGITCPAAPLGAITYTVVHRRSPLDFVGGLSLPDGGRWASLYWLIALPLGYALTALLFRRRGLKRGVSASYLPYVLTGIALLAFLFVISPGFAYTLRIPNALVRWQQFPFFQGLTPLLTVALGLFVLAWAERSAAYAAFAAVFLGVACMAGAYNIENLFFRINLTVPAPEINVIVPGAILLLGAAGFWVAARRSA
jgi:hypothetical protein